MSFSWEDEYDERHAPDSKTKRAMKQENEKVRSSSRKEYSQSVRSLVKFVRNKDPRWAKIKELEAKNQKEQEQKLKLEAQLRRKEKEDRIKEDIEKFDKLNI